MRFEHLNVVVSIDGLQPEHDERRKPATYERIQKSIAGSRVTIHCTITGNIASRPGYLEEFLRYWTVQPEIRRVWFSLFTPQRGAEGPGAADSGPATRGNGGAAAVTRHVTNEIDMHLAIYKVRPDVQAVVHAHPVFATAFACSGLALDRPLCAEVVMTLGSIPLAPYATTGTCAVAKALAPFLPGHDAVLLANHGVVTYGHSLNDALMKMETVEHFAQICIAVRQ